jgi:hypothetical protein
MPADITVSELGRRVKAKTGEYTQFSDAEVGKRYRAKYPDYSWVKDDPPEETKPSPLEAVTGTVPTVMTPDMKIPPAVVKAAVPAVEPARPRFFGSADLVNKAAKLVGVSPDTADKISSAMNWIDPVAGITSDVMEGGKEIAGGVRKALGVGNNAPFTFGERIAGPLADIGGGLMKAGEKPGVAMAVAGLGLPAAAAGLATGMGGDWAAQKGLRAVGASEGASRLGGLVTGLVTGGVGGHKLRRLPGEIPPSLDNWFGLRRVTEGPVEKPLVPGTTVTKTPSGKVTVTIGKGGKVKEVPVDKLTDAQRDAKIAENQRIIDELTAQAKAAADKNAAIEASKAKGKAKTGTTTSIEEINAKIAAKKAAEVQAAKPVETTPPPVVEPPVTPTEPSRWDILDPDGEIVETTSSKAEAEAAIAESGQEGYTIREVPNEPPPLVPETLAPVVPAAPAVLSTPLEKVVAEPPALVPVTSGLTAPASTNLNERINARDTLFHSTTPSGMLGVFQSGKLEPGAEGTLSLSRVPVGKYGANDISFEIDPSYVKGRKPVKADVLHDEYEMVTDEPVPIEAIRRIVVDKKAVDRWNQLPDEVEDYSAEKALYDRIRKIAEERGIPVEEGSRRELRRVRAGTPAPPLPTPPVLATPIETAVTAPPKPVTPAPIISTPLEAAVTAPERPPITEWKDLDAPGAKPWAETVVEPPKPVIPAAPAPDPAAMRPGETEIQHALRLQNEYGIGPVEEAPVVPPVETPPVEPPPVVPPVIPPVEPPVIPPVDEVVTAPIVEPPIVPPVIQPPPVAPAAPPILSTPLEAAIAKPIETPVVKPRNRAEKRAAKAAAEVAKGGKPKFSIAEMTPPETPVTPPVTPPAPILSTPLEAAISATPPNPALLQRVSTALGFGDYKHLTSDVQAIVDQAATNKTVLDSLPPEANPRKEPVILGSGFGALEDVISKMGKPNEPRLVNWDTLNLPPEVLHKVKMIFGKAVGDNKLLPHVPETEASMKALAKSLGIDDAQDYMAIFRSLGPHFRAAGFALRQHINSLSAESVALETKIADPLTPTLEKEALSRTLQRVEWQLANLTSTFTGAPTEHGRNLHSLRYIADATWDVMHWLGKSKRYNRGMLDPKASKLIQEVIAKGKAAEEKGDTKAAEAAKKELVKVVGEPLKRDGWDLASDLYKSSILSSPTVHQGNIIGTGANVAARQIENLIATPLDWIGSKVSGNERQRAIPNYFQAIYNAVRGAKNDPLRRAEMQKIQDRFERRAASGDSKAAEIIRKLGIEPNFWLLGKEDSMFKAFAFELSISEQAKVQAINDAAKVKSQGRAVPDGFVKTRTAELEKNPNLEMQKRAAEDAQEATFNQSNFMSEGLQFARAGIRRHGEKTGKQTAAKAYLLGMDFLQPFSKVPANVVGEGVAHSVGAPVTIAEHGLKSLYQGGRNVARQLNPKTKVDGLSLAKAFGSGLEPQNQAALVKASSKAATGTLIAMAMFQYMKEGKGVPMSVQNQPDELNRAKAKNASPGSSWIDGNWVKLNALGPYASVANMAMDNYAAFQKQAAPGEDQSPAAFLAYLANPKNIGETAWKSLAASMLDLPMFKSIADAKRVLEDKGEGWQKYASNKASSMIPYSGLINETASIADKSMRNVESEGLWDTFLHTVQTKTGAGRSSLPPRITPTGAEVPSNPWNVARPAKDMSSPVTKAADRLEAAITPMPYRPKEDSDHFEARAKKEKKVLRKTGETEKQFEERAAQHGIKPVEYSKDEHIRFQQLEAFLAHQKLDKLVKSHEWGTWDRVKQQREWKQTRSKSREGVNNWITGPKYQAMTKEQRLAALEAELKVRGLR